MKSPAISERLVERVLSILDRLPAREISRVLVLGSRAAEWSRRLAPRGLHVALQEDVDSLPHVDGSIDLVLAVDVLERAEWDRWTLQQAHRALKDGGRLVLVVRNLSALGAPGDLAFLASRFIREAKQRLRVWRGRPPARLPFSGRRHRLPALTEMLESLGFRVSESASFEPGWLALLPGARRFHSRHVLVCERGPSLFGLDPRRPFPAPGAFRQRFEAAHRALVDDRERWLERHPEQHRSASRAFDPAPYRGATVLVLAPHPDDDVIPCGGTLLRLISAGARVTVLHATDGSEAASLWHGQGEMRRRTIRLEEARVVGDTMGFDSLIFWKEDNSAFRLRDDLVQRLAETLGSLRPRLIFVPFVTDIHPDHVVLSRILERALAAQPLDDAEILSYQTWCLVPIDTHSIVTREMPLVERALSLYATAMKVEDYVHFAQDHNYYTACTRGLGQDFAEAFVSVPASRYATLLDPVETARG